MYLHFQSAHPRHMKRNIPYVLFQRVQMIVSDEKRCLERYIEVRDILLNLGYPTQLVDDAMTKSQHKTSGTVSSKCNEKENNVAFVTDYSEYCQTAFDEIADIMKECGKKWKVVRSYRISGSLRRLLSKTPFKKDCIFKSILPEELLN